jgi:hypothetical protein
VTTVEEPDAAPLPDRLASAAASTQYARRTHEHVQELLGAYLNLRGAAGDVRELRFDIGRYRRMEKAVLEGGTPGSEKKTTIEAARASANSDVREFDAWAGRERDHLLIGLLDESARQQWADGVAFARMAVYNDAVFRHLYGSHRTPWTPLRELLSKGVVVALAQPDPRAHPIIRARGVSPKLWETKVDNRYDLQLLVHAYLAEEAYGHEQTKVCSRMCKHLDDHHSLTIRPERLQRVALAPLKRVGLIGSTTEGYFLLVTPEDCRLSIEFHASKIAAMQRVVEATATTERRLASG